jgi:hypothetical protein
MNNKIIKFKLSRIKLHGRINYWIAVHSKLVDTSISTTGIVSNTLN